MERVAAPMAPASVGETCETSACKSFLRSTGGGVPGIDRLLPRAENTHWDRVCYRYNLLATTANSPFCIPSPPPSSTAAKRDLPKAHAPRARVAGTFVPGPARG